MNLKIFPAKISQEICIDNGYVSDYGLPKIKRKNKDSLSLIEESKNDLLVIQENEHKKIDDIYFKDNNKMVVILEEFMKLPPGNFFFPLKNNIHVNFLLIIRKPKKLKRMTNSSLSISEMRDLMKSTI